MDSAPDYLGDMLILERGLEPVQAQMLCECLRIAGIHADLGDANLVQANALWSIALGGAKLRVPAAQMGEAREVLAAFRRGEFALDDDFDEGASASSAH